MDMSTADADAAVPRLAPRDPDANKGDFGRVLLVAGSRGMSGAAVLCAPPPCAAAPASSVSPSPPASSPSPPPATPAT